MRPHFAVVLLAASLVATMDKAERLRQTSSPPGRKSGDDSVQGHVRAALATDEERGANTLFLNAGASQLLHLRESGQHGAWLQPQKAVEETMGDQHLLHAWENYLQFVKPDNFHGVQQLVKGDDLLLFASTIARLKRGSERAKATASLMEIRLYNMWLGQEMTPGLVFDKLKVTENDLLRNTPAFAMWRGYMDFFLLSDFHAIQKANLMTYKRPVSDELNDLRLPSDADNDLRLPTEHEHESDNNPRKRERESDNNPTRKRDREFDDNRSKRMRESDDNLSKRMRGLVV
nr:ATR2 protein [Hyaloperonospora arabidopsidis]